MEYSSGYGYEQSSTCHRRYRREVGFKFDADEGSTTSFSALQAVAEVDDLEDEAVVDKAA